MKTTLMELIKKPTKEKRTIRIVEVKSLKHNEIELEINPKGVFTILSKTSSISVQTILDHPLIILTQKRKDYSINYRETKGRITPATIAIQAVFIPTKEKMQSAMVDTRTRIATRKEMIENYEENIQNLEKVIPFISKKVKYHHSKYDKNPLSLKEEIKTTLENEIEGLKYVKENYYTLESELITLEFIRKQIEV